MSHGDRNQNNNYLIDSYYGKADTTNKTSIIESNTLSLLASTMSNHERSNETNSSVSSSYKKVKKSKSAVEFQPVACYRAIEEVKKQGAVKIFKLKHESGV